MGPTARSQRSVRLAYCSAQRRYWTTPGASILGLQNPDHLWGLGPEPLQLVKFPLLRAKNVNYDVAKVQEDPAGGRVPHALSDDHLVDRVKMMLAAA